MSQVLCLFLGIIIGAAGTWAAMAAPPRESFGDVGWRSRLGGRLGIDREDGGAHVRRVGKKVVPMRRAG